jgi:hypothetical protein
VVNIKKLLSLLLILFLFGAGSSINASIGLGTYIEDGYSNMFKVNANSIANETNEYFKKRISELKTELEKINVSNQEKIKLFREDQSVSSQAAIENQLRSNLNEIEKTKTTLIDDNFIPEVNEIKVYQLSQTEEDLDEILNEILEN